MAAFIILEEPSGSSQIFYKIMSEPIIKIENISKKYMIGHKESYYSLRDQIAGFFLTKKSERKEEFWALKDINLEIKRGETIGIIGRNGAGKSTLLKILSQITPPTTGKIAIHGRVASLLEVGTGFNPELTGRENIFLNGAILGMTRNEIRRKFDEIVAFSEIKEFLDTPVKRYSSGMYVRLAFAIAAHLEPEILIVDEVLAVGDAQFQKKSLGKMSEVSKGGRTVIFVSHNMAAIRNLCTKSLLISEGKAVAFGKTNDIIEKYSNSFTKINDYNLTFTNQPDKVMQFQKINISFGKENYNISSDCQIRLEINMKTTKIIDKTYVTFSILDAFDSVIYWASDINSDRFKNPKIGEDVIICECPKGLLTPGRYSINFAIMALGRGAIFHEPNRRISFELTQPEDSLLASYGIDTPGYIGIPCKWSSKNDF
jgi:lipopolysaccharide transport system ATP-binding protein